MRRPCARRSTAPISRRRCRTPPGGSGAGGDAGGEARAVLARVQTTVRGQLRTISVPVRYQFAAGALIASGDAALRQSDIGLTPFSALMGALQVQDEMRVRFRIVARAACAPHLGAGVICSPSPRAA